MKPPIDIEECEQRVYDIAATTAREIGLSAVDANLLGETIRRAFRIGVVAGRMEAMRFKKP